MTRTRISGFDWQKIVFFSGSGPQNKFFVENLNHLDRIERQLNLGQPITSSKAERLRNNGKPTTSSEARALSYLGQPTTSEA